MHSYPLSSLPSPHTPSLRLETVSCSPGQRWPWTSDSLASASGTLGLQASVTPNAFVLFLRQISQHSPGWLGTGDSPIMHATTPDLVGFYHFLHTSFHPLTSAAFPSPTQPLHPLPGPFASGLCPCFCQNGPAPFQHLSFWLQF